MYFIKKTVVRKNKSQRGQGMTEYLIIVALIAVAAVVVYQSLGETIRHKTAAVALSIAGEDATSSENAAKNSARNVINDKSKN